MSGQKKRGAPPLTGEKLRDSINKKIDAYINALKDDQNKAIQIKNNLNTLLKRKGLKFDSDTYQIKKISSSEVVFDYSNMLKESMKQIEQKEKLPEELTEEILEFASPAKKTPEEIAQRKEAIKKKKQENLKKAREARARYQEEKKKQQQEQQKQQQTETKTETKTETETKKQKKAREKDENLKDEGDKEGFKMYTKMAMLEADEQVEKQRLARERAKVRLEADFKKQLNNAIKNYIKAEDKNIKEKEKQKILFYSQRKGDYEKENPRATIEEDEEGNIISIIDETGQDLYEQKKNTQQLISQITEQPKRKEPVSREQSELIDPTIRSPSDAINTNPNIAGAMDQLEINQVNNQQTNINAKTYEQALEEIQEEEKKKFKSVDALFRSWINGESKREREITTNLAPDETSPNQLQEEKENLTQNAIDIINEEINDPNISQMINSMIDLNPSLAQEIISRVEGKINEEYEEEINLPPIYEPTGHLKDKLNTLYESGGNEQDMKNEEEKFYDEGDYLDFEDYDYEDFENYDYKTDSDQRTPIRSVTDRFGRQIRNVGDTLSDVSNPFEIPDSISQVGGQVVRQVGQEVLNRGINEISRKIRGKPNIPNEELTEEQLLLDQLKRINENLDRGGSYPEEKPLQKYRFPEPYENYNAVPLVQNSVTGYLNDYNLYGNVQGVNLDEI